MGESCSLADTLRHDPVLRLAALSEKSNLEVLRQSLLTCAPRRHVDR